MIKALFLLSLLLVGCYTRSQLRGHPLNPLDADPNKSLDSSALNLIAQGYQTISISFAQSDPQVSSYLRSGINLVVAAAKAGGALPSSANLGTPTLYFASSQALTGSTNYQFGVSLADSSNSLSSTFVVNVNTGTGQLTLSSYTIDTQTVATQSASVSPSSSQTLDPNLANSEPVASFLNIGVAGLIQAAVQKGDIPSGTTLPTVTVNSLQKQIIGNDYAYLFQVNLKNNNSGIQIAASLTVTYRAATNTKLLTSYGYNLQISSVITVNPSQYTTLNAGLATSDADIKQSLDLGVTGVLQAAIQKGDIPTGTTSQRTSVNSLQRSNLGNDVTYVFSVTIDGGNGISVGASFAVTTRAATQDRVLAYYAYNAVISRNVQVNQGNSVTVDSSQATTNSVVRQALSVGTAGLLQAAIQKGDLPTGSSIQNTAVNSIQNQVTGNDNAYTFQVTLTLANGVVVSASLVVTYRAALQTNLLTSYSYSVQTTRTGSAVAGSSQALSASSAQSDATISQLLNAGVAALTQIIIQKGDLPAGTSLSRVTVNSLQKQATGNDVAYLFQVFLYNAANANPSIAVGGSFTVVTRASTQSSFLTDYAYNVQTTTRNSYHLTK